MNHVRRKIEHILVLLSFMVAGLFMYLMHLVLDIILGNGSEGSVFITVLFFPVGIMVARLAYVFLSRIIDGKENKNSSTDICIENDI